MEECEHNIPLEVTDNSGLILDKEQALKQNFPCPECGDSFLIADENLTVDYRKKRKASFLNELKVDDKKEVFAFMCTNCGYRTNSDTIDVDSFRLIKQTDSLLDIAIQCNPYTGQTWSAGSGFPTETCPINGNQCYTELWKVCPHIGNGDIYEMMKDTANSVPIIGEIK